MRTLTRILLLLPAWFFVGCDNSASTSPHASGLAAPAKMALAESDVSSQPTNTTNTYLAYEHYLTIDASDHEIKAAYEAALDACRKNTQDHCTILESNLNTGDYPSAQIRLRIDPAGVPKLTQQVTQTGKVTTQSTRVEDLAAPIVDTQRRMDMLTAHRERLLALQEKANNDIDALIKISQELANVQNNLEEITGQNKYLMQRVNMQIMNIQWAAHNQSSFWKPIARALDRFSNDVAQGIANFIRWIANSVAWILLIGIAWGAIILIRKFNKK